MSPNDLESKTPIRYVIYSKKLGIHLGDTNWSLDNPGPKTDAPTYLVGEANDRIRALAEAEPDRSLVLSVRMVWPDRGDRASIDACANAALPRWTPAKS